MYLRCYKREHACATSSRRPAGYVLCNTMQGINTTCKIKCIYLIFLFVFIYVRTEWLRKAIYATCGDQFLLITKQHWKYTLQCVHSKVDLKYPFRWSCANYSLHNTVNSFSWGCIHASHIAVFLFNLVLVHAWTVLWNVRNSYNWTQYSKIGIYTYISIFFVCDHWCLP